MVRACNKFRLNKGRLMIQIKLTLVLGLLILPYTELALEGLRFFDIRRWGIAESVMPGYSYGRPRVSGTTNWPNEAPKIDEWGTPDYSNVSNKNDLRILETRIFNPDKHYLLPIPIQEMEVNSQLVQNPNW